MRVAIMQPYFFPYQGYFELIKSVDMFVLFNDVQYLRRGWMNRNRIKPTSPDKYFQYITIPVQSVPRNTKICHIKIDNSTDWHGQHLKMLRNTYGKHIESHPLYLSYAEIDKTEFLCELTKRTLEFTARFLGCKAVFADSRDMGRPCRPASRRLLDICSSLEATEHVNLSGGADLYEAKEFAERGIKLNILPPHKGNQLSILDECFGQAVANVTMKKGKDVVTFCLGKKAISIKYYQWISLHKDMCRLKSFVRESVAELGVKSNYIVTDATHGKVLFRF